MLEADNWVHYAGGLLVGLQIIGAKKLLPASTKAYTPMYVPLSCVKKRSETVHSGKASLGAARKPPITFFAIHCPFPFA